MSIKALITTLAIVGSSTAAMARPAPSFTASASLHYGAAVSFDGPVTRDHRWGRQPVRQLPARTNSTEWRHENCAPVAQMLSDGLMYNAGEFRKDVLLEGQGRFNNVIVQSEGGSTFINKVAIEFTGGAVQIIPVNRTLSGNQQLSFDLDGSNRAINRIFVYRADGGTDVSQPSRGEFAVLAV
jgi:hypothetical protein